MKAIVQNAYGSPDLLEFKEIERPAVRDSDVLARVHAAGLNAGDYFTMRTRWANHTFAYVLLEAGYDSARNVANADYEHFIICYQLAMTILGTGSIFLCYLFYKTKLLPPFLALWGLVGYVLLTLSGILDIAGVIDTVNGNGILLYISGGIREIIVLPVWLFVKGFNVEDVDEKTEGQDRHERAARNRSLLAAT